MVWTIAKHSTHSLRVCLVAMMRWDGIEPSHPRWCLVYGSGGLCWTQEGIFSQYAGWDGSTKSVGRGGTGRTQTLAHRTHRGRGGEGIAPFSCFLSRLRGRRGRSS
uniref:Uncharacterized protein n=1 Tax=Oryza glumipatula TaxID=40148 RepID=A0A0D9ZP53_9ORYZ